MRQILKRLNEAFARYLVIGGQAVRLHGFARRTMDWDLFIPPRDEKNFATINACLGDILELELEPLGAGGEGFLQTYQTDWGVLLFHLIIPGIRFDEADPNLIWMDDAGTKIPTLCAADLLKAKTASNRPSDQDDIIFLEAKLEKEREIKP